VFAALCESFGTSAQSSVCPIAVARNLAVAAHEGFAGDGARAVPLTPRPQALKHLLETAGADSPINLPLEILWKVNAAT
jgi:hypothetical protein